MKQDSLIPILRLTEIQGLGPTRIRSLIAKFGEPESVFKISITDLCRVEGINLKLAQNIKSYTPTSFPENQLEIGNKLNVKIISLWDQDYPTLLKKIYDPPILLFIKGEICETDFDSIAIIGTRAPTTYGKRYAHLLSTELAKSGLTIISGFARGIDTIAHVAALSAGGRTIAVLGNGLDLVYPAENRKILPMFRENGVILTEFPFGTNPDAGNFPQRNRIISGLSHGTIVVEAGNRSGALLTAMYAVDQNRDVFAVPGRLTDKKSVGCLRLIRHGAIPVENTSQIVEVIKSRLMHPPKPVQTEIKLDLTKEEMKLYQILTDDPKYVDDIVEQVDFDSPKVLTLLLTMELKGVVRQLSGKQFVRA